MVQVKGEEAPSAPGKPAGATAAPKTTEKAKAADDSKTAAKTTEKAKAADDSKTAAKTDAKTDAKADDSKTAAKKTADASSSTKTDAKKADDSKKDDSKKEDDKKTDAKKTDDSKKDDSKKEDDKKTDDKKDDSKKDDGKKDDGKKTDAKKDDAKKDEDKPHFYRKNAWNDDQNEVTHQTEFDEETKKPSGYLDHIKAQTSADIQDKPAAKKEEPKKEDKPKVRGNPDANGNPTISYIVPHSEIKGAWTDDHHDHSNEKEFEAETQKPTGYQAALGALVQNKWHGETNSVLEPYK